METILLVGAGGHAKACIDVIEQQKMFEVIGLVGDENETGGTILGYPIIGTDAELPKLFKQSANALVTTGQIKTPETRIRLFDLLTQAGFNLPSVISPQAYVSNHAKIGSGSIVLHGAIVNAGAVIGDNCIINSRSLVEHDAMVGHHCHISTGAIINGDVSIGSGTFVGSGSVVRESIVIGERCVIGMGQLITGDCAANTQIPAAWVTV